jgi:sec-independent protein translocase protein TatB
VFNFSGSEIVFLLLIALVVLGPEKLPEAIRRFGKAYAEFKKLSTGFQSELKSALDEPMREMRETADAFKKAATFDFEAGAQQTDAHEPQQPVQQASGSAPPLAGAEQTAAAEPAPVVPVDASVEPLATGIDAVVVRDAPVAQAPKAEPPVEGEQGAASA